MLCVACASITKNSKENGSVDSFARNSYHRLSLPERIGSLGKDRQYPLWYCPRCRAINYRQHLDKVDFRKPPTISHRSVATQTVDHERSERSSFRNMFINCTFGGTPTREMKQSVQKSFTDAYEHLMVGSSLVRRRPSGVQGASNANGTRRKTVSFCDNVNGRSSFWKLGKRE